MDSGLVSSPSAAATPVTTAITAADITTVIAAAATTGFLTIGDPESRLAAREALKAQFRQQILAEQAALHPERPHQPPQTEAAIEQWRCDLQILAEQAALHPQRPHQPPQTETAIGQWRCDLCEMSMASEAQFTEHLEGVKHRDLFEKSIAREASFSEPVQFVEQQAKEEKGPGFFCDVCQMGMTGETAMQDHLKGRKHRNKAVVGSEPFSGGKRKAESGDEPAGAFYCDLCQVSAPSAEVLDVHLKGKKHRSKVAIGVVSTFECGICGVQCTGQSGLDDHLTGKKHKAMVEKSQKDRQETTASTTDTKARFCEWHKSCEEE